MRWCLYPINSNKISKERIILKSIKKINGFLLFSVLIITMLLLTVSCTKIGSSGQTVKEKSSLFTDSFASATLDEIRKLLLGKTSGEENTVTVDILFTTPEFFQAFAAAQAKEQGVTEDDILKSYKDRYSFDKFLVFAVDLNTHSVDLSNLEMDKISLLRDDQGNVYSPTEWREVGDSSSSHHTSGALLFPLTDREGEPVISDKTKYIEIIIKDLAGVKERLFRWDLPIKYSESS